jgi:hypothetical protein
LPGLTQAPCHTWVPRQTRRRSPRASRARAPERRHRNRHRDRRPGHAPALQFAWPSRPPEVRVPAVLWRRSAGRSACWPSSRCALPALPIVHVVSWRKLMG